MKVLKVTKNAKLAGIKGSSEQREKIAQNLCADFSKMVDDVFESREKAGEEAYISASEIHGIFKKLAPNVRLKIIGSKNSSHLAYSSSSSIDRFIIKLPFDKKLGIYKSDSDALDSLNHEKAHFFHTITEPKYPNSLLLSGVGSGFKYDATGFYSEFLYKNEVQDYKLVQMNPLLENFFSSKTPFVRKVLIKQKINKFFKENNFPPEAKIKAYNEWRYMLVSEIKAFKEGEKNFFKYKYPKEHIEEQIDNNADISIFHEYWNEQNVEFTTTKYLDAENKKNEAKSFLKKIEAKHIDVILNDVYFFQQKLDIINSMLASELQKIRKMHAKIYPKTKFFE